ncbi:extracellular solute-binding protein [Pseudodesulfovibrio cashew]|uniref:Extracellular solute-binding protein n=1 Tax=Pseudodesulfovibrio cashew TaxID=2678688 RepID=A0A6I6JBY8_9BACT|nr:ABC transporter substrate-binding protein [Pseudodesulfovibrio cashew]QGY38668.1 extracellular solute-binding protein [Pseudodesulfovibrio cashew]
MRRRDFMKLAAMGAMGTMIGGFPGVSMAGAAKQVNWLTWENLAYDKYIADFIKSSGINIQKGFIGSDDEQFAKIRAGGGADWDLITPGLDKVELYVAADLLQPLDLDKIPNAAKRYAPFMNTSLGKKDGQVYGIPFYWGINPIVYRADLMDEEPDWSTLFEGTKYKGRLAMRDYALEAIAIAAMYVGIDRDRIFKMDDKELAECKKACIAQKKLLRTYWNSIADLTNLFAAGEVVCAFSWVPPYYDLRAKGIDMGMAKPKEGVIGWCDTCAIPKDASPESAAAAHELINYVLGPDYGYKLALDGPYAISTSTARAKLTDEQQERVFIKDIGIMDSFLWKENPTDYGKWVRIWNEVKAS